MNARGDQFGSQRVIDALRLSATGHSAAEIRTAVINAVNRFKGDIELEDDLTLVVAKIAG